LTPMVYLATRAAGGTRAGASLAGGLAIFAPDLVGESLIFQPESLTAFSFALCAAAFLTHGVARRWWSAALLSIAVAFSVLAREHGLIITLEGLMYLLLFPPRFRRSDGALGGRLSGRLLAPVLLLAVIHLSPLLIGVKVLAPMWDWPWNDKASVPLRDIQAVAQGKTEPVNFGYLRSGVVQEAGPGIDRIAAEQIVREYNGFLGHLGAPDAIRKYIALNARWAVAVGHDLHLWILAGVFGTVLFMGARRRWDPLCLLLLSAVMLPVFVIWSQRRHVTVLLPIAFIGVGLGWSVLEAWGLGAFERMGGAWRRRVGLAVFPLIAVLLGLAQWQWQPRQTHYLAYLSALAQPRRAEAAAGRTIRERVRPGDVLATMDHFRAPRSLLRLYSRLPYGDLPHNALQGVLPVPHLGWRAFVEVNAREKPGPGWAQVVAFDNRMVYQYRPEVQGEQRRCAAGVLTHAPRFMVIDVLRYRLRVEPLAGCNR